MPSLPTKIKVFPLVVEYMKNALRLLWPCENTRISLLVTKSSFTVEPKTHTFVVCYMYVSMYVCLFLN